MDAIEEILREKILGRITELENRKDHSESLTARSIIDIRLDELHSLLDRWGTSMIAENLLLAAGLMALLFVAVKAVAWRLAWEDRRNPTHRMKRGEASRWWLLILVPPVLGVVAVKTGHVDVARYCVAATLGLPLLTLTEKNWMRSET